MVLNYLRELGLQTSRLRTIYLEYLINKRHVPVRCHVLCAL